MRVCVAGILFWMLSHAVHAEDVWYGVLDAGVREFRFVVEPAKDANVASGWQLVSLDEGGAIFGLDVFEVRDRTVVLELRRTKAEYSGTLSDDGLAAVGNWKQGGADLPLRFRKLTQPPADAPDEIWEGELATLFQKLKVRIRIYRQADGSEKVVFDSVTQRAGGFKATRTIDMGEWTVEIAAVGGGFRGHVSDDQQSVSGKWSQGGADLDLVLSRTQSATADPGKQVRPQTPQPPYPYASEDVVFASREDGVSLAGTLTLPEGDVPVKGFPAAVLISGSGPQDRDETLLGHKPFAVIADYLTRHGIAVLRFDDRGTGQSTGDFSQANSVNFASDAAGAVSFLKARTDINAAGIGLIGHSEGGLIAPMVARDDSSVAWIILLAGPGVTGEQILKSQGQLILKAEGETRDEVLSKAAGTQDAVLSVVRNRAADVAEDQLVSEVLTRLNISESDPASAAEREALKLQVKALNSPWFRFFLVHDPAPVLRAVRCPVLALNGEKDVQVDPKLNLPVIRECIQTAGHRQSEVHELPGLNHLFQTCRTGGVSEYQLIEETISPEVLSMLPKWIRSVVP